MKYQERVLAFVDILGFSDIVGGTIDDGHENEERTEIIYNLLKEAQDDLEKLNPGCQKPEDDFIVNQFSDSIVISCLIAKEAGVLRILSYILFLCTTALQKGILFRGVIVSGKLMHEEKIIFGPALVKAARMEEKLAIYPRIVLDDEILEIARTNLSKNIAKSTQLQLLKKTIKEDFDGLYYISLTDGIQYIFGEEVARQVFIDALKDCINKMEERAKKNLSLRAKYSWLKKKCNNTFKKCWDTPLSTEKIK